jgi:hypothetical protein
LPLQVFFFLILTCFYDALHTTYNQNNNLSKPSDTGAVTIEGAESSSTVTIMYCT